MMESKTIQQTLDRMRKYIYRQIAAGFAAEDKIRDIAVEVYSDEQPAAELLPYAKRFVEDAVAAHLQDQADWENVTDYDRLTKALEDLENQGIVSRQNFSCCGTCGADEIIDEMEEAKTKGKKVRGYAFFHEQDTEHAVEGKGLYLSYGSIRRNPLSEIIIGYQVVKTIRRHGLITKWNGNLLTRIHVQIDWKRRR
jgi:hypothetical protein